MYFYSSASPDAPKLKNNWGDFNTLINYIIDGGSNYKILKIEPNPEKENTVKVYYEESIVGTLLNYNSGNLDLYNEENGELYHIPFSGLKWLLPVKDKNTKES